MSKKSQTLFTIRELFKRTLNIYCKDCDTCDDGIYSESDIDNVKLMKTIIEQINELIKEEYPPDEVNYEEIKQ